jgi:hypothetical protein
MIKWLQALDPALQAQGKPPRGNGIVDAILEGERRPGSTSGRPSRKKRPPPD